MRSWKFFVAIILASGFAASANAAPMQVKADSVAQLRSLAHRDHFAPNGALYSGVLDPALRISLNARVDAAIEKFIAAVGNNASKAEFLTLMSAEIAAFDRAKLETEDAEQVGINFERIMDCIGLESSDGILNKWMYGFDPNRGVAQ